MRRGNRWTQNRQSSSRSRQSRERSRRQRLTGASEIYDDLLEEAFQQSSPNDYRPLKKRKSQRGTSEVAVIDQSSQNELKNGEEHDVVVIESSSNEFSDDEDIEWDNVELHPLSEDVTETQTSPVIREVTLVSTPQNSGFFPIKGEIEYVGRNVRQRHPVMQSFDKSVLKHTKCISSLSSLRFVT